MLEVRALSKDFTQGGPLGRKVIHAVHEVNFSIGRSEIVALVGESGSGKSTIARILARIEEPTSGSFLVNGVDVLADERRKASLAYRGDVQMVFQDPFSSINPAHPVETSLRRSLELHRRDESARSIRALMPELMNEVGLNADMLFDYPHQLSGGQRQRVAIARALATRPRLILADEPTSMLDVSVRIGILNLMARLRDVEGISMLFITHDLASARYLADTTLVMFAGELVEGGESLELMANPAHPYTQILLSAIPDPRRTEAVDVEARRILRRLVMEGHECPFDGDPDQECSDTEPVRHHLSATHWVRCHRYSPRGTVTATALVEIAPDTEPVAS
jgi:peptide/nickel transport system ATP-binding protein